MQITQTETNGAMCGSIDILSREIKSQRKRLALLEKENALMRVKIDELSKNIDNKISDVFLENDRRSKKCARVEEE